MDWFLYDNGLHHERVKVIQSETEATMIRSSSQNTNQSKVNA